MNRQYPVYKGTYRRIPNLSEWFSYREVIVGLCGFRTQTQCEKDRSLAVKSFDLVRSPRMTQ